ncbi:MAG: type IVB secretion system coupling complex protein DotM/IcmP [Gammaproteobacteria bacterium]|nr:type IVB secretion system coupling complex protein DotM/IcmP [Gammaproteobacteria bacterium]MCH9763930.1 type IVB secretion system coupling complex protein DotM/IcmP [Gammaproteobacteria bacterium]
MAGQQQQSSGGGGDDALAPVWITILLLGTAYLIWYFGHAYIVSAVFFLNALQAKLLLLVFNDAVLQQELRLMQTVDTGAVSWSDMVSITTGVGEYTRYPVIACLAFLAFHLYRSNVILKFKKTHSMNSLKSQEQANWPCIIPAVTEQNLVGLDVNKGVWSMAMTPVEFARKNKLLRKKDALLDNPMPGQEMTAGVRRGDAKRVFTLQLGPYWDGFENCTPQARALAAVFMARMCRDRKAAELILTTLDKTSADGRPDYSVALPTIKKYENTDMVQNIVQRHAYQLTVVAALLIASRDDGVVPSAEFLWLKPVDRRLWYMLNTIGRQTAFSEVGGPFAHLRAEQVMGRRSLAPMIDEAIKALEVAVKEVQLSPKDLQELTP